ncbi:MAG: PAS domain S-box protein [Ignavibacteriales bacterium]|nr:MAG: PAS domain S-box protein [Ignavibacteriales bacterium]
MLSKIFRLTIGVIILLVLKTSGQSFNVQKYTVENGLPDNGVYDITQDDKGRMWFATLSGISRYDGAEWINYNSSDGLSAKRYFRVVRDVEDKIWAVPFSPFDTIAYYTNKKWKFIPFPKEKILVLTSFQPVRMNGVVVPVLGTSSGVFVFKNKSWQKLTTDDGLIDPYVNSLVEHNGKVYICTKKGISVYNGSEIDNSINTSLKTNNVSVYSLFFSEDGAILIFDAGRIARYQNSKLTTLIKDLSLRWLPFHERPVFIQDKKGRIYFGNSSAKFYIDENTGKLVQLGSENGFISAGANSVFIDKEENIWFSYGRGVDKISTLRFINYNENTGLLEDEVASIASLDSSTLVFGHNMGLTFFSETGTQKIDLRDKFKTSYMHFRVGDMAKDSKGNIWFISAQFGLGKISKSKNITWYSSDLNINFNSIAVDDNDKVWIASTNGLFTLSGNRLVPVHNIPEAKSSIRKIEKINGLLYLLGPGIRILDPHQSRLIKTIFFEKNNDLNNHYSAFKNDEGKILIGNYKGVYELSGDTLLPYEPLKNKIKSPVYFITQDREKNYWIGTNKGVYKWDNKILRQFTKNHGLAGNETNRAAVLVVNLNRVWIGTDEGVSCYLSEYDTYPEKIPDPQILYFELEGKERFPLRIPSTLSSSDNTLYFYFRGVSFVNERSINFRIMLEPFDTEWIEIRDNSPLPTRYTNLNPGTYVLRVQARNGNGEWSEEVRSAEITINQPFYRQAWFVILLMAIAAGVAYAFYKYAAQRQYFSKLETEIIKRTSELRASEYKYRELVKTMNEGLAIVDVKGKYQFVNQRYCEMIGASEEELLGANIDSFGFNALTDQASNQIETQEKILKRKDGSEIYVLVSPRQLFDLSGIYQGSFAVFTDITQRKKVELSLQETNERYKELAESFTDMFFALDRNLCYTYWNSAAEKITGIQSENVLGKSVTEIFPKINSNRILVSLQAVVLNQKPVNIVFDSHKDEIREYFEFNIYPSRQGLVVFCRDITERIAAEEAVRKYSEELKELNAAKDKFFSIISHDLKSPFQGLLGFSSVLKDEYENLTPEEIKTFTSHIQNTTKNLYNLLQTLLQWSRIQTGKMEFHPAVCNLNEEVTYAFNLLQGMADNKRIKLQNKVSEEISVYADTNMLNSIFLNLITNAIKFTLPGGSVTITAIRDYNRIKVSVEDTGVGIKAEHFDFLFRIDKQFTTAGTDRESGSGLGLIICKDLVRKHNGEIYVESEPGRGTRFIFTLPDDKKNFR